MALILDERNSYKGYRVDDNVVSNNDFQELDGRASAKTDSLVAVTDLDNDEFVRVGQGRFEGQEYTKGRGEFTIYDSAGNELDERSTVALVVVSGQNNEQGTIKEAKYRQWKQGIALEETGRPIVADPKNIGLTVQSGSDEAFTIDFDHENTQFDIDVMRGEQ